MIGRNGAILPAALAVLALLSCSRPATYNTFADYPGFQEFYGDSCRDGAPGAADHREQELLRRFRPRFVIPPGGEQPLDFYGDYLPCTVMRRWPDGSLVSGASTKKLLEEHLRSRTVYLDFDPECFAERTPAEPVVYGRVYREKVAFDAPGGGTVERELIFLKYNPIFSLSGLAADLPLLHRMLLVLPGLDARDWHELDNFTAVHIVLDEREKPLAVLLAQHNHHRTYLLGKDISPPPDGRLSFDVAERSNELYPSSTSAEPVRHRVVQWSLYLDYLLSGENKPFFSAHDITRGVGAGGAEVDYRLAFLLPCDPLYRAEMLLGEPRPFMGRYIGRDGPPGSDYYNVPSLLPLGRLLKFSYLQDGDGEDIAVVREAVDRKKDRIDIGRIAEHGGRTFFEDWMAMEGRKKE